MLLVWYTNSYLSEMIITYQKTFSLSWSHVLEQNDINTHQSNTQEFTGLPVYLLTDMVQPAFSLFHVSTTVTIAEPSEL